MTAEKFEKLIDNLQELTKDNYTNLVKLSEQYPYFQSAYMLILKYLNDNNKNNNKLLGKYGVFIKDRELLFKTIKTAEGITGKNKQNSPTPLKETGENTPDTPIIIEGQKNDNQQPESQKPSPAKEPQKTDEISSESLTEDIYNKIADIKQQKETEKQRKKSEPKQEVKEVKLEPKIEKKSESKTEQKAKTKSEQKSESKPEPKSEQKSKPVKEEAKKQPKKKAIGSKKISDEELQKIEQIKNAIAQEYLKLNPNYRLIKQNKKDNTPPAKTEETQKTKIEKNSQPKQDSQTQEKPKIEQETQSNQIPKAEDTQNLSATDAIMQKVQKVQQQKQAEQNSQPKQDNQTQEKPKVEQETQSNQIPKAEDAQNLSAADAIIQKVQKVQQKKQAEQNSQPKQDNQIQEKPKVEQETQSNQIPKAEDAQNLSAADTIMQRIQNLKNKNSKKDELIDKFVATQPSLKRTTPPPEENVDIAQDSTKEKKPIVTELMANIYINQGYYDKAIEIFQKLILKNPEKKDYFAVKIKETQEFKANLKN